MSRSFSGTNIEEIIGLKGELGVMYHRKGVKLWYNTFVNPSLSAIDIMVFLTCSG